VFKKPLTKINEFFAAKPWTGSWDLVIIAGRDGEILEVGL